MDVLINHVQESCETIEVKVEDVNIFEQFIDENGIHDRNEYIVKSEIGNKELSGQLKLTNHQEFKSEQVVDADSVTENEIGVDIAGSSTKLEQHEWNDYASSSALSSASSSTTNLNRKSRTTNMKDVDCTVKYVNCTRYPVKISASNDDNLENEASARQIADDITENYESNDFECVQDSGSCSELELCKNSQKNTFPENEENMVNEEFATSLNFPKSEDVNIVKKENVNTPNLSESTNEHGKSTKDDSNMFVSTSRNPKGIKKLFCMYCGNFQSKFARHLEMVHKDETEVKKFTNLKKGSAERKKIIEAIRKNSQFHFNTNNAINNGELIVPRRPGPHLRRQAVDYAACHNCKGFFTKRSLRHHARKCFSFTGKKHRNLLVMGRKMIGRIHPEASNTLRRDIFPILREDDVIRCIRYDRLIILFGNKMCCKYRSQTQHDVIRAILRVLGRYLIALKEINQEITEFSDIYNPQYFVDAISAMHVVGGFEESTNTYKSPSTAYNLGSLLKKIGNILVHDCIQQKLIRKKRNAEDFLKLLVDDIDVSVTRIVVGMKTKNLRQKKIDMPSEEAIQKLCKYLKNKTSQALKDLKAKFSQEAWMDLAKITLTSVHLFNRLTAEEIESIFIEDFKKYSKIDKELLKTLEFSSRKFAESYVRFNMRGKLNRTIPVLLSQEMVECIETLLKFRRKMRVHSGNKYVFGIPGAGKKGPKHLQAGELMRIFAVECGVPFLSALGGTKLRNHIATNCINLNLSESEISDEASSMGRSENINKEQYRHSIVSREIQGVSNVLELAQGRDDTDSEFEEEVDEGTTTHHYSPVPKQPSTSESFGSMKENTPEQSTSKKTKSSNGNLENGASARQIADDMTENYESNDFECVQDSSSCSKLELCEDSQKKTFSENEENTVNEEFETSLDFPKSEDVNIAKKENINTSNLSESTNEHGKSTKDDSNMFVSTSRNPKGIKKLFCMYCGNFQSKFARHLEMVHKDETEVKKFTNLKKGSAERKKIIETIRKNSQFHFNTSNAINNGELIVSRRPGPHLRRQALDYAACHNCEGFFTKRSLRHHARKCFSFTGKKHRNLLVMGRKMIGRIHPEASNTLRRDIFPILREDDVIRCIRYDRLIILFGNKMCCKYRSQTQHDVIRAILRVLGRYLIALKEINQEITEFSDIYNPQYFVDAISAMHVVGGFEESTNTYKSPFTAYNLGSLLKKIGNILVLDCIQQKLIRKKRNAEDFLKLLVDDIDVSVNRIVVDMKTKNLRQEKIDMPSEEAIQKLCRYLKNKTSQALKDLKAKFSQEAWMDLAKTTLTSVHLFNRRTAEEIESILIDDFKKHSKIYEGLLRTLEFSSRKFAENYVQFNMRGKLTRTVPVLLSQEMVECIETLLKFRRKMRVHSGNKYVFGIPGSGKKGLKHLQAGELMRIFAVECGAPFLSTLRGTKLRNHIATNCINLNLSESEISDVASFMGRSENINKEQYRHSIVSREIQGVSNALELARGRDDADSEFEEDVDEGTITHNFSPVPEQPSPSESFESIKENTSEENASKKTKRSTSPFGPVKKKRRWNEEEVSVATMLFAEAIKNEKYPSLRQIRDFQISHPCLKNRSAPVIKTWISNKIKLKNKEKR